MLMQSQGSLLQASEIFEGKKWRTPDGCLLFVKREQGPC